MHKDCPPPEVALVSLKYDGVRVQVVVEPPYAYGICRRGYTWSIPILHGDRMVLDCEYMQDSRSFIVFDMFEHKGKALTTSYSMRLATLATVVLPVLMGYSMKAKVVYPACALTNEWYEKAGADVDGVIVHDGVARLGEVARLYKWKPVHTVDLYVGPGGVLMDGKYTAFMSTGSKLTCGEIWECRFEGNVVVPVKRRTDKSRANARHVCREIRKAHESGLSATDVGRMLTLPPVRVSKRVRGI
jgi:ATP-dependent DNA ligase